MSKKNMSFEEALQKLEKIVEQLEAGEVPLEESIKAFEEGKKLVQFCLEKLNQAEIKVKKLTKGENGTFSLEDFEQ